jgi:hypothetical protein
MINLEPTLNKLKRRLHRRIKKWLLNLDKVLSQQVTSILQFLMPGLLELNPHMVSNLKFKREVMRLRESRLHKSNSLTSSRRRMTRRSKLLRRLDKLKLNKSQSRRPKSKEKLLRLPKPRLKMILRCQRMSMMISRIFIATPSQRAHLELRLTRRLPRRKKLQSKRHLRKPLRLRLQKRLLLKNQRLLPQSRLQSKLLRNRLHKPHRLTTLIQLGTPY